MRLTLGVCEHIDAISAKTSRRQGDGLYKTNFDSVGRIRMGVSVPIQRMWQTLHPWFSQFQVGTGPNIHYHLDDLDASCDSIDNKPAYFST